MNSYTCLVFFACCCLTVLSVPTSKSVGSRFAFGNNTYEVSHIKLPWVEAKNDCAWRGMRLVSVESEEEHLFLTDILSSRPNDDFWTSGTDLGQEGDFYWEGTGELFGDFHKWSWGQPTNQFGTEHCVTIWLKYGHLWNDDTCTIPYYYICEYQPCSARE